MSMVGYKKTLEAKLKADGEKNPFRNRIVRLHEGISSDPDVLALIEGYKRKLTTLDQKRKSNGCGVQAPNINHTEKANPFAGTPLVVSVP